MEMAMLISDCCTDSTIVSVNEKKRSILTGCDLEHERAMVDIPRIICCHGGPVLVFERYGQTIECGQQRVEPDIFLVEVVAFHGCEFSDRERDSSSIEVAYCKGSIGCSVGGYETIVVELLNVHDDVWFTCFGECQCFQFHLFDSFESWSACCLEVDGKREGGQVGICIPGVDE